MFIKKADSIASLIELQLQKVNEAFAYYIGVMEGIENSSKEQKAEYMKEIDLLEDYADDVRHQIIKQLLEGRMLLESSKSFASMIEHIDDVVNQCEDIVEEIYLQDMKISPKVASALCSINSITEKQLGLLEKIVLAVCSKYSIVEMQQDIKKIEEIETDVDGVEHQAIKELFASEVSLAEKLQQKEIIRKVGHIADIIEDLSDEVEIIMMTRRV